MAETTKASAARLRLGVAGGGTVFERCHAPALRASLDWEVAAVCDPVAERRALAGAWFPGIPVFTSLAELLHRERCDAILIASPPATHAPLALEALARGVPVLVEKPLALTSADAAAVGRAAESTGRTAWVGFNRRFREPYALLKRRLAALPGIDGVRFTLILDARGWGSVTPFLGDEANGGGVWEDAASHQVDLLSWLLDSPIVAARAVQGGPNEVLYELRFERGPVAVCVAGHGSRYEETLGIRSGDLGLVAHPAGVAEIRRMPGLVVDPYLKLRSWLHFLKSRLLGRPSYTGESFARQLAAFARAVRGGEQGTAGADHEAGERCARVLEACRSSMLAGGSWTEVERGD